MAEFDEDGFADAVERSEVVTSAGMTHILNAEEFLITSLGVVTELPEKDLQKAILAKEEGNKSVPPPCPYFLLDPTWSVYFVRKNILRL
jgi:hypothetical protein